jgi:Reverse transcriptase (RNA-dependent DNA polymerase)
MKTELNEFAKHNVWTVVKREQNLRVFPACWVLAKKDDNNTKIYKARYVACGNRQDYYIDHAETFAPTVAKEGLRIQFSLAVKKGLLDHQMDVKASFLHGKILE